jgi:hypothetical protein
MGQVTVIPRAAGALKPPHGSSCNQCGVCCIAALCPLAAHILQRPQWGGGGCPALQGEPGGRMLCGMVNDPARWSPVMTAIHGPTIMREAALLLIGAADGCDARINGEPINHVFKAKLARLDRDRRGKIKRARACWRMPA